MKIGIRKLCYAILKKDDTSKVEYEKFTQLPGVNSLNTKLGSNSTTYYADDGPYETASTLGEIKTDIEVADLSNENLVDLLGHNMKNGILIGNKDDNAPYVAIGFECTVQKNKTKKVWLLKGQFSEPDDDNKSKTDKVDMNGTAISGTFLSRVYDGNWRLSMTEGDVGFDQAKFDSFLTLEGLNGLADYIKTTVTQPTP